MAFYDQSAAALWTIQEDDPALVRYVIDDFFVKDHYCQVYKAIFSRMEEAAAETAAQPPCAARSSKFVVPPSGGSARGATERIRV